MMVWTEAMDDEYSRAHDWYEINYHDDVEEHKKVLKEECEQKLAQIREDIENGLIE